MQISIKYSAKYLQYQSWLERQIVVLNVVGSSPISHPKKSCKFMTYRIFCS